MKPVIYQHPELDGSPFHWKGTNDIGVLLVHGFTATSVEVRQLGRYLNQAGYSVAGPLLPGHGTDPDDANQFKKEDWIKSVNQCLDQLATQCKKIFIGGESMGGLLSLICADSHPSISGILLYAPAVKVPGLGKTAFLAPFKNYIFKKNTDDTMPWQGYNVIPLAAARQLWKLQAQVKQILPNIVQPIIIFQGILDQTIDPISSKIVYETVSSKNKEYVQLEESGHCILLDVEKEKVFSLSKTFIERYSS